MDSLALKRVVALIDMDCFYCQVELRLDPSLAGKPMAVVQYNDWKQGGIIAVNYEARDRGVTRFMRGEDARKVCPEISLPSVPSVRGKADLTRYRNAGAEVANVFSSFSDCVERASIDEAFIDLTSIVDKRIREGNVNLRPENLPSTFVVGYSDLKSNEMESRCKGTTEWIHHVLNNADHRNAEYRLAVGAVVVEKIRSKVLTETGFHCSAGIAHNKILAKLVAGLHKPKCQTVIPHENVPELFESLPVRKVRNLGGKFGRNVAESLKISFMSELFNFSEKELVAKFNAKNGAWLYNIARGVDYDPVTPRLIPESIGCSKNFPGPMAIKTKEKLHYWLKHMAAEVVERLEKDQSENMRKAKLLTVTFKQKGYSGSRSCPLVSYRVETIAKDALELLLKLNQAPSESPAFLPSVENLGISTSKFTSVKSTIMSFFKEKSSEQSNIEENNDTENEITHIQSHQMEDEKEETSKVSVTYEPNKSPIKHDLNETARELADTDDEDCCENIVRSHPPPISSMKTDPSVEAGPSSELTSVNEEKPDEMDVYHDDTTRGSDSSETSSSKELKSFFAKVIAQKKMEEKSEGSPDETKKVPSTSVSPLSIEDMMQNCPECNQNIHLSVYLEHLDYHEALKVHRALNGLAVVKAVATRSLTKKEKPAKKKRKITEQKPNQVEITKFFEVLPK